MTDLFANQPKPKPHIGYGNALYLADLTAGTNDADLKRNIQAGKYPDLGTRFLNGWRALAGRTPK